MFDCLKYPAPARGSGQDSSGDLLLDLEHKFSADLRANPVPAAELPQPPYSWESWVDDPNTTDRALAYEGIYHALYAVKNIRGGRNHQGSVAFTLSEVLTQSYQFARCLMKADARGVQFVTSKVALQVMSAALSVANEWYPAALDDARREGFEKGHAAGYAEGYAAAVASRRTVLENLWNRLFDSVDKTTDNAVEIANAAAEAAKKAAEEARKAAPWIAVAALGLGALALTGVKRKR